jgi:hypothetical protein
MIPRATLRLLVAILFGVSAVAHVYAITSAAMLPSAATEVPASDHGMDCGGGDKAAQADCIAACATAIAILCEPVRVSAPTTIFDGVVIDQSHVSGRGVAPEPHPPKGPN